MNLKKLLLAVFATLLLLFAALFGYAGILTETHPSLETYRNFFAPAVNAPALLETSTAKHKPQATPKRLTAQFLGTSSIVISDGETTLMTDGFFTRPSQWEVLFKELKPNVPEIKRVLKKANVNKLAAVMVVHSHHDHAMDAPEVARQTGAVVIGSESTANIARGAGLTKEQIRIAGDGAAYQFGKFLVVLIESKHTPVGEPFHTAFGAGQEIKSVLNMPARVTKFKPGMAYSVYLQHPLGNILIQGSAGYKKDALKDIKADVVFLGVAGLSKRSPAFRKEYFHETIESVGAKLIYPIHWDDFLTPLREQILPANALLDNFDGSMKVVQSITGAESGRQLLLPLPFRTISLYEKGAPLIATKNIVNK